MTTQLVPLLVLLLLIVGGGRLSSRCGGGGRSIPVNIISKIYKEEEKNLPGLEPIFIIPCCRHSLSL